MVVTMKKSLHHSCQDVNYLSRKLATILIYLDYELAVTRNWRGRARERGRKNSEKRRETEREGGGRE